MVRGYEGVGLWEAGPGGAYPLLPLPLGVRAAKREFESMGFWFFLFGGVYPRCGAHPRGPGYYLLPRAEGATGRRQVTGS